MAVRISNITATFSNSSVRYDGFGLNVNAHAHAGNSTLINLKVSDETKFSVHVNGNTYVNSSIFITGKLSANGSFGNSQALLSNSTGGIYWGSGGGGGGDVTSVAGRIGDVVLVANDVGLALVDNTSDLNKPISTATQTALDLKAPLASPALTGTPTAPTVAISDVSNTVATTSFVQDVVVDAIADFEIIADLNYQPIDPDLTDLAALAKTDGNIIVANGTAWIVESGSTARTSLGVAIGSDVQAYSAILAGTTASFTTADETKLDFITVTQTVNLDTMESDIAGKASASHTHIIGDTTGLQTALDLKAPLASPALTGTPTAPTPVVSDDSNTIATTAFVQDVLAAANSGGVPAGSNGYVQFNSSGAFGGTANLTFLNNTLLIVNTVSVNSSVLSINNIAVSANSSTGTNGQVLVTNGSSTYWGNIRGWELVEEVTATNTAFAVFSGFNSTYLEYLIIGTEITSNNDTVGLYGQVSVDSGSSYLNTFSQYAGIYLPSKTGTFTSTAGSVGSNGHFVTCAIGLNNGFGTGANEIGSIQINVINPASTIYKFITFDLKLRDAQSGTFVRNMGSFEISNNSPITNLRLRMSAGNIKTGNFKVYGLRA